MVNSASTANSDTDVVIVPSEMTLHIDSDILMMQWLKHCAVNLQTVGLNLAQSRVCVPCFPMDLPLYHTSTFDQCQEIASEVATLLFIKQVFIPLIFIL